jgi:hypothetical protein
MVFMLIITKSRYINTTTHEPHRLSANFFDTPFGFLQRKKLAIPSF